MRIRFVSCNICLMSVGALPLQICVPNTPPLLEQSTLIN